VGCGNIANNSYLPYIARNHRLVAVCDINAERARRSAELWGAERVYDDPEKLLKDGDVEAVVITTSHDSHALLAMRAAEEGKHYIVQKPLALSMRDAEDVVRKTRRSGVKAIAEPSDPLLSPLYREAKARLGEIGDVCFSLWHTGHSGPTWSEAFFKRERGGSVIFDLAVYDVAANVTLFGMPRGVIAAGLIKMAERPVISEKEVTEAIRRETYGRGVYYFHDLKPTIPVRLTAFDNAMAALEYYDGSLAGIIANYVTYVQLQMPGAQIYGTRGALLMKPGLRIATWRGVESVEVKDEAKPYYHRSVDHLAECIEKDEQPLPSVEWGFKVTSVLLALERSAYEGRRILLDA